MKIQILQEKLKKGLNIIERISSKSLTLPILNNILISSEKNFLKLTATDLEIGINWWVLAKIEKEGKITIPSRLFSNFINLLPNKKINLEVQNNNLILTCENYKTQINGLPAEEFPLIPKITESENIYFEAPSFCRGLSQLVDIAVLSTARPEISGIYFLFQKDFITVAATDSFRLGETKIPFKNSSLKKEYSLILPQKTIKEIINIFGEKTGEIKMFFSPNQVMFEYPMEETPHPQTQIISRLIEGEYPNYQEIIPKKFTTQLILNRTEFLNQVKTASLFSGKINEVKIKISPTEKKALIFSRSPDLGEYQSSIPGKIKGEPVEISFNHRFLLDGLSNIKSSEVILELNGDSGPGVVKPVGDDSYIYVVMPIKAS
ncbi:MAG: DNA polymerase III subunit beta [Candidatus Nealsonbacteria bacterium CG10_big_fil_rev_8_21_14_0_10_36_24]|uniref:Beta sliding clamp n=2 Tax=Candidatus Nealsoniibacteriota TaxID=1817911 RepID=A0A2H0YNF3_9BACT|nr:MAG: DNA polymerase III subunit beta [Candidatus Nealsonbacteria bacterium CG10_big_fil_rev_8_21_14_0_10_36_24]PIS40008.1 MAG: DNA polymerase III subunit beta [Candidatus Nealsonbacteria bacterium CG08_land_8_20_14_0_20_36_22]